MSILIKSLKPQQVISVYRALGVIQGKRNAHWYPDYKPASVPKTEEERLAAAKKYNLLPEEYESYESDDLGFGDYPKLPYESVDSRDPWYPWDNEELRKNFNEPVNVRMINCLPEMDSTGPEYPSHARGVMYFFIIMGSAAGILFLLHQVKRVHRVSEKQYPTTGVTHYTFESDYDEEERRAQFRDIVCRKLEKGEKPKEGEKPVKDFAQ